MSESITLHWIDWSIIISYILFSLGVGIYFSKRAASSTEEYFLSGRSLPWWIVGTSMVATTFAADTPLHDGAVLVKGDKIISAGVILPLSRQGISRYGTRHLAALGITERFDRCICIVVSEETGTLSLANQGKLERPITSSRLQELLNEFIGNIKAPVVAKSSANRNVSSPKKSKTDIIQNIAIDKSLRNSD